MKHRKVRLDLEFAEVLDTTQAMGLANVQMEVFCGCLRLAEERREPVTCIGESAHFRIFENFLITATFTTVRLKFLNDLHFIKQYTYHNQRLYANNRPFVSLWWNNRELHRNNEKIHCFCIYA